MLESSILIHLHVPKCAGSSVNRAIADHFRDRALAYEDQPRLHQFMRFSSSERDSNYDAVFGHLHWGFHKNFTRPVTYISIIRDVHERIYSFYNYIHTTPSHPLHTYFKKNLRNLNDLNYDVLTGDRSLYVSWSNYYCLAYFGETIKRKISFFSHQKNLINQISKENFICGSVSHVESFLQNKGIIMNNLPKENVTNVASFQDYEIASSETISSKTASFIASINQFDLRLIDRISYLDETST